MPQCQPNPTKSFVIHQIQKIDKTNNLGKSPDSLRPPIGQICHPDLMKSFYENQFNKTQDERTFIINLINEKVVETVECSGVERTNAISHQLDQKVQKSWPSKVHPFVDFELFTASVTRLKLADM